MTTSVTADKKRTRLRLPSFGTQVLIGLVLGVVLGLVARSMGADGVDAGTGEVDPNWLTETLSTVGGTFVTLLRAVVPPLVFLAIVASIANLRDVAGAARLAWRTLMWFAITALIAVVIGIVLGLVLQPGDHTSVTSEAAAAPSSTGSWLDFLTGLVPANVLGLEGSASDDGSVGLSFNVLQILVVSIAVGIATLKVGEAAEPFLAFVRSALAVVQKVLWWIILLAPIATVGLLGNAVASYGWDALGSLGMFTVAIYAGLAIVIAGVYPALLRLNGLSVRQFFSGAWPAISLAFVSRSSIGTMPVTESVTERNLGVPRAYASFAVPLGATTKMDGCASIYPAISAIFVAQFFGLDLSITDYVLIAFVSVIGSAATAGVTGATVMLTLTLSTLGLPLEGVGLLLAIDPILDMGRTAVNVTGQALVPTIVAKREGILDQSTYDAPRGREAWREDADTDARDVTPAAA
ncbi:dicarboxylate/amino acid:cation symporter [Nocardioides sp. zg-1228]|uniref:dicarboxylate/amino acid:cation symporter n=1 Tax=Nocardioides sp. zg-1228 TaxID=2763008 RepID=UPI001642590B|nr:dicarboxylate/amino acid:cation symporter [Nocardioides sp. zg-1228]MBC2933172.1 dicarboxylate/amino acid:cation symporter [Nocardioides sp. zg-1228]QSF56649.1 dicarboxylate/amino acid:cation symporter [Nocardioides sp. zg-1228]